MSSFEEVTPLPLPRPTDALGERTVETRIYVFAPDAAAVSNWEDETRCELHVESDTQTMHVVANVAGLRSPARHCLTLAQEGQEGNHFEYDADGGWFDTTDLGLRISRAWD